MGIGKKRKISRNAFKRAARVDRDDETRQNRHNDLRGKKAGKPKLIRR